MTKFPRWAWFLIAVLLILFAYQSMVAGPGYGPSPQVSYTQFKSLVRDRKVEEVTLKGEQVFAKLTHKEKVLAEAPPVKAVKTRVPGVGDDDLLDGLETAGVEVNVVSDEESGLLTAFVWLLPLFIFFGLYVWFWQRMSQNMAGGMGRSGQLGGFLQGGSGKKPEPKKPDTRFSDVAGQDNAKREVAELVDFLRTPEKYHDLGAEVPTGVLLNGSPGTGKTLLARALAGEAEVPFYSISGSEFIEVFVGVGASRVRNLFKEAKENAPAIIFIDELDSIGRMRGAGFGGGHDEREQTLNQILAEMDGFEGHESVIVLAATNRPDVLDPALMRPGRFDRHITLEMPDKKARRGILAVHTDDMPLADDVDLDTVAAATVGFSGADLENLCNEAGMMAAREDERKVHHRHFDAMRERVMIGSERALTIEDDEKERLAVHESGHTAVAYYAEHADPLFKVSIIPRGQALGGTQQLPERERYTLAEDYLKDRLAVTLGGRAAEKLVLGTVSSGADDDIRQATRMAKSMVARWGMSDEIGPMDVRQDDEHPFLGREMAQPRSFSEATAHAVDQAVQRLLIEADERAVEILRGHRKNFDKLVRRLRDEETLYRDDIAECLKTGQGKGAKGGGKAKTPEEEESAD